MQDAVAIQEPGPTNASAGETKDLVDLNDPALYVNREISWLAFNERVLNEAGNERWPLLERAKFLAIYASNLDEFFMIRVSGLREQLEAEITETSSDGLTPEQQLEAVGATVRRQLEVASALWADTLLPTLREQGIHIDDWKALDSHSKRAARTYFRKNVFPVVTPLAVNPGHPFPFLSNLSLSLAVEARDPETHERKFARIKVPEILPRFVPFESFGSEPTSPAPAVRRFLPLEQLLAANLDDLFPGMEILGAYPFRVTRDMDIDILEDEAHDLLHIVDRELRKRRFGACVRLEVTAGIPDRVRRFLVDKLEIEPNDVYETTGPLGLSALMALTQITRPDLRDPTFVARTLPEFTDRDEMFGAISKRDILLHHPYDSFAPVLQFLKHAADDPDVLAIKMTLYRAGANAEVVKQLIRAAENRKQVAVSVEIKARFDEENNIAWARALERAGAHVFFGHADLKTHAKAALVIRRESDGPRRYVHLSTGNYNEATSRLYTDIGLFTADREIGEDVSEFFNALSGFSKKAEHRRLAVAPIALAKAVIREIDLQTERARAAKPARIFAKVNALVDTEVIQALYRASQAGVAIQLCVRGICCLRPGVPGVSENIRVTSILGRFLEHTRAFVFGPPEEERFFLSSADWMPRNLHRRVEILFPVLSERLREQIRHELVEPTMMDNDGAYDMTETGTYNRRTAPTGVAPRTVQSDVLERVARRTLQVLPQAGGSNR